jgi:Nucleotidyl transferase AbiEii toxin, Type IV TA system
MEVFKNMRLAGGTSLALQIGHRKSIDLDLFGTLQADETTFSEALAVFEKVTWLKKSSNINIFSINEVKVDFVNYSYPWLDEITSEDDLRLAGLKDIAAMKLAAVTGRGTKKDFIDIYFLLKQFSLKEMLQHYTKKYADGSEFLVLKSLTYFEDAEPEQEPAMLKNISWQAVKDTVLKEHSAYLKSL